ncbi:MAG: acetyl-CoA decarbonylase/synthase complex subunit gamma [Candidatus Omnitrophota bacterium]|nr:MAG: acetyl-CoA decarbonylase/synthase complex subunit gamma [Candidatus Omnitrophota bacterium]
MALSGLDIYKLLPKTNCRECGFVTCLAFAMQLAKKGVSLDKCPHLSDEAKSKLQASSLPPIKLITIGEGEKRLEIGNETVLFRHEEKFHHPCGLGFIIEDSEADEQIKKKLEKISQLKFERIGQQLEVDLIAVKQTKDSKRFQEVVKLVSQNSGFSLILMCNDPGILKEVLPAVAAKKPLIHGANAENVNDIGKLAKEFKAPVVVCSKGLDDIADLTKALSSQGAEDLVLDTGVKSVKEKIWELTQIRRLALKKSNRSFGYPILISIDAKDPYEEIMEAATYIAKYAGIILLKSIENWQVLSLLTLRQNIYTDPQKPLQIEPKLYQIGQASDKSPLLITTNFSLSYYTVLGEVEASKIPAHILSVDTEGMSVLTAWAAEKFTPEKIVDSLNKAHAKEAVSHNKLIIPGYVAVMSGDLEEKSGCQIIVGPKEAAGIPSFLKNL